MFIYAKISNVGVVDYTSLHGYTVLSCLTA